MNNKLIHSCFFIACCGLAAGCGKAKEPVKENWPSGKLKKSGWVNKDNQLIDTTTYYFENGKTERIEVRDDSGRLNGVTRLFHGNGLLSQEIPYVNNAIEGFISSYNEAGHLSSRIHRVKARQLGDAYWFDEEGKIYQYGFFGFGSDHRNYIKYDKAGKIIEKIAPFIFMDSLSTHSPGRSDEKVYELRLLLSNAPGTRATVVINYLGKDSTIIKQDSISGRPYLFTKEKFPQDVYQIIFYGRQYDSLTGKNLLQQVTRPVDD